MKLLTQWAVTSSALILIVLAVRFLFRNRLSARLRYALWGVVLLRLLVPFQVELPSPASDSLPLLASNLAPEVADVELYALRIRSSPLLEESLQSMRDSGLKPGDVIAYEYNIHQIGGREMESVHRCFVLSEDSIDTYFFYTTLPKFLMALWVIGALCTAWTIFSSNRYFSGRLRYYRHELEGADTPIPVYTAANLSSPCLFGVLRPAVYLSPGTAEDPDALRHILAHELTHYRHKDHIWSTLRCLALALHWYNPLVWLAVWLSKGDGELACDEGAVARLGESERIPYGRTLVDMVAARSLRPADLLSCSTAMTGGRKSIQQRVAALVKKPETVKTALFAVIAVVALAAVFVFAGRGDTPAKSEAIDAFLAQTGEAQLIGIGNPAISSQSSPPPISDPELLAQARELLSKMTPVAYLEGYGWDELSLDSNHPPEPIPQEELEHQHLIAGHPLVLYPTAERDMETAHRYWLVPWNTTCLLVQWYPKREENTVEILASLPGDTISRLMALARQQRRADPYQNFLNQITDTKAISYRTGTWANGGVISEANKLARAREYLTGCVPLDSGDPGPEIPELASNAVLFTLWAGGETDRDGGYVLYWDFEKDGYTYILLPTDRASGRYTPIARTAEPINLPPELVELAKEQQDVLREVLLGQAQFQFVSEDGSVTAMDIRSVPAIFSPSSSYAAMGEFTVIDLDGDGVREVVVHTADVGNDLTGYLVLRQREGQIYGYPYDWRTFWNLKTDGSFDYSLENGSEEGTARLYFSDSGQPYFGCTLLAMGPGGGADFDTFLVNGDNTTGEEYNRAVREWEKKPDAPWYDFTEVNIRALLP